MREPLPENIQKMMEQQEKQEKAEKSGETREALPFERRSKKKASS
jgi:YidC/Oxa1 family membrane protein insertase